MALALQSTAGSVLPKMAAWCPRELEVRGGIEKEQQGSQPLETWINHLTSGYSFAGIQVSCRYSNVVSLELDIDVDDCQMSLQSVKSNACPPSSCLKGPKELWMVNNELASLTAWS
eukprot:bmy_18812T0